jgi:GTP-binding protein EngB required for normal cell division
MAHTVPAPAQPVLDLEHYLGMVVLLLERGTPDSQKLIGAHALDFRSLARGNERIRRARRRSVPTVALVGQSNVGKSTLLNVLLGAQVAAVLTGPCTPCPVVYSWGAKIAVAAKCAAPENRLDRSAPADLKALQHFLCDPALPYDEIQVSAPCDFLREITLIDTPGFGAADLPETEHHLKRLTSFLERRPCPVYWCIKATQPPEPSAMEFYRDHLMGLCDEIILTFSDKLSEASRAQYEQRYARFFPDWRMPPIHFLSDSSSVDVFRKKLLSISDTDSQAEALFSELCGLCEHLARTLRLSTGPKPRFNEVIWNNDFVHSADPRMRRLATALTK